MKKVSAIIERAADGSYSVYHDDLSMGYLVTGTGDTAEKAIKCFNDGYEDFRRIYEEEGKTFQEVEFIFKYDVASFLSYFSKAFSLAGLSRITGINQGQLSHYLTGRRTPSATTVKKLENAIHEFAKSLEQVKFA